MVLYSNLEAEMARRRLTRYALAEKLGVTPTTLSLKLHGKSNLSLKECVEIKRAVAPDCTLDYLFATAEDEETEE